MRLTNYEYEIIKKKISELEWTQTDPELRRSLHALLLAYEDLRKKHDNTQQVPYEPVASRVVIRG